MKIFNKIQYILAIVGFITLTNRATVADDLKDASASTEGKHHAFFLVTGPNLDDATAKKTVFEQMSELGSLLSERNKESDIVLMRRFDISEIRFKVNELKAKYGPDNVHITCIINSHGHNVGGQYQATTHHGQVTDVELKSVFRGCKTTLALFTCHAGAFIDDEKNLEVFGTSPRFEPMAEFVFVLWLKALKSLTTKLKTAIDFMESWGATLAPFLARNATVCSIPYWASTFETNQITSVLGDK
ncbi:MAG: hypothetical protein J0G29_02345 [Alphaproteobacteria bacterium]|nr:hypothetical protein [Alphaproteobacteria bacterium]OJV45694.1 MAG: hypothetical protein BGO28_02435 [Alphaproteobacteria bacterium 43-37]